MIIKDQFRRKNLIKFFLMFAIIFIFFGAIGADVTKQFNDHKLSIFDEYASLSQEELDKRIRIANFDYIAEEFQYYKNLTPKKYKEDRNKLISKKEFILKIFIWVMRIGYVFFIISAINFIYDKIKKKEKKAPA